MVILHSFVGLPEGMVGFVSLSDQVRVSETQNIALGIMIWLILPMGNPPMTGEH